MLGWSIVLGLIGIIRYTVPLMYCIGTLAAWIYLRFYQKHTSGQRGDAEEHFRFARCVSLLYESAN